MRLLRAFATAALSLFLGACPGSAPTPDGGAADAGPKPDGGALGAQVLLRAEYTAPPESAPDDALTGGRWRAHLRDDLLPYWLMPEAWGVPEGNFPMSRGMDGALRGSTDRRPRMLGRQTYGYAMAYLLTGDPRLLQLAHAGVTYLARHAVDPRGGCHAVLDAQGEQKGTEPKYAQDITYCALGFSAWYFVTRDPAAEAQLLAFRDLLFDPAQFWDPLRHRIKDGRTAGLDADVDAEGDGGSELVAQLDAINALLLLTQPVLSQPDRRAQFLADLRSLGQTLIDDFWQDGLFWGVDTQRGAFGSRNADWGHTLKSYWMLVQIDKRLAGHPFRAFLEQHLGPVLDRAWDAEVGRWNKRPTSATDSEHGSDWWIYAEADQLLSTLDLAGATLESSRTQALRHWLADYVDTTSPSREIIPGIRRDGAWAYPWRAADTAKCNQWKSSFHSTEHALVNALVGDWRTGTATALHFAVPEAQSATFIARPYLFEGRETARERAAPLQVGDLSLRPVTVRFVELW